MNVTVRNLTKRFDGTTVVRSVSLEVGEGELFFLLGPSGCGKTTLLRLLAGFYQPDEGEIFFGNRCVNSVPPNRRNTAMVFQSYALWPHLTVFENVAYGLDVRGVGGEERKRRVMEVLELVRMSGFAWRSPVQLSG
ncbi:MAG: ABC transporter ATP-binding protein, partial [Verrucomicrobiae bacterium]|nr:ABC transporter ATP-binding protein [Verrucomicrobiae bacterium]